MEGRLRGVKEVGGSGLLSELPCRAVRVCFHHFVDDGGRTTKQETRSSLAETVERRSGTGETGGNGSRVKTMLCLVGSWLAIQSEAPADRCWDETKGGVWDQKRIWVLEVERRLHEGESGGLDVDWAGP
jgi:hypothetical protein